MVREGQAGAVVVDQAFQPVGSGRALQQVSGHAQRAKPRIYKIGQVTELCVRSPDGIIEGHVVCNDGAGADEFLDVAGQLSHGWGICDVNFEIEDSEFGRKRHRNSMHSLSCFVRGIHRNFSA